MALENSVSGLLGRVFRQDAVKPVIAAPLQEAERKVAIPASRELAPAKPLDAASYKQAVGALQLRVAADKEMEGAGKRGRYGLEAHDEAILKTQLTPDAKGTVLLFHGYTAGPWQYAELADKLYKDGYNVYAPRLPGHGLTTADDKITNEGFVHAADRGRYDTYVDEKFREAASLGRPVTTIGLSGGTNCALRAAEKHPEVQGVFAMAPYLGPNRPGGILYAVLTFLDKVTFGLFGRLMDHIPIGVNGFADSRSPVPHDHGTMGEGLAVEVLGAKIRNVRAPIQFVTTANDGLSGTEPVNALYQRVGADSKNGWYHFSPQDKVPHAMVSWREDTAPGAVEKVDAMVLDFMHGQLTVRRPPGVTN